MADSERGSDASSSERSEEYEEDNLTRQMDVDEDEVRPGKKPKLKCQNCTREFRSPNSLLKHVKEDLSCQAFQCRRCDAVCGTKMAVMRHYDRKHPEHKEDINEICPKKDLFVEKRALAAFQDANRVCYICFQPFRDGASLKKHLDKRHNTQALAACLRCGAVTGIKNIKKHYRSKHPEHVEDVDEIFQKLTDKTVEPSDGEVSSDSLACLRCSFHSKYRNNMWRHYRQNHPENLSDVEQIRLLKDDSELPQKTPLSVFSCSICSFRTKYRPSVIRHYKRRHPEDLSDLEHLEKLKVECEMHENDGQSSGSLACMRCSFQSIYRNNMCRHYRRRHPEYVNDVKEIKLPPIPVQNKPFDPSVHMSCMRCSHFTKYLNNLCRHYKRLHPEHLEDIKKIPKIPMQRGGDASTKWWKGSTDNDWKPRKLQVGKTPGKKPEDVESSVGSRRSERRKSCPILRGSHSPEAGSCSTYRKQYYQPYSYMETESDPEHELTDITSPRKMDQNVSVVGTRRSSRCRKMTTPRKVVQNVKRGPGRPRKIRFTVPSAAMNLNTQASQTSPQTHLQPRPQGAFFFGSHGYIKTTKNENGEEASHMEMECNQDHSAAEHEDQANVAAPIKMDHNVKRSPGRPRKGIPKKMGEESAELPPDAQITKTDPKKMGEESAELPPDAQITKTDPKKMGEESAKLHPDAQITKTDLTRSSPPPDKQTCAQDDIRTTSEPDSETTPQMEATLLDIQTTLLAIQNSHKEATAETSKISHNPTNLASEVKLDSTLTNGTNPNHAAPQQAPEESASTPGETHKLPAVPVYSPRKMPTQSTLTSESILNETEIPAWGEVVVLSQASGNEHFPDTVADADPSESIQIPDANPPKSSQIPDANLLETSHILTDNPPESLQMVMETCEGNSSDEESRNECGTSETTDEVKHASMQITKEGKLTKMTETVTWATFHSGCKVKERKRIRVYEIQDT